MSKRPVLVVHGFRSGARFIQTTGEVVPYRKLYVEYLDPIALREDEVGFGYPVGALECTESFSCEGLKPGDLIHVNYNRWGRVESFDFAAE